MFRDQAGRIRQLVRLAGPGCIEIQMRREERTPHRQGRHASSDVPAAAPCADAAQTRRRRALQPRPGHNGRHSLPRGHVFHADRYLSRAPRWGGNGRTMITEIPISTEISAAYGGCCFRLKGSFRDHSPEMAELSGIRGRRPAGPSQARAAARSNPAPMSYGRSTRRLATGRRRRGSRRARWGSGGSSRVPSSPWCWTRRVPRSSWAASGP